MEDKICIKNIGDLFPNKEFSLELRNRIDCIVMNSNTIELLFSHPIYLNAFIAVLVLSGTSEVTINNKSYPVQANTMILLTVSHLFSFKNCSPDFKCIVLLVSKEFMDEMDATDMIYRRIKYGAKLYGFPILQLAQPEVSLLEGRMKTIDRSIDNIDHFFYKDMILNNLFAYYLDLSNIIERKSTDNYNDVNLSRYENMIKSFIELLVVYYRKEHKIDFYASQLNVTPHYLTLIVKRITGQTVADFIFEMLYSEARNLLTHSRLSIQEIALQLHFSDQSSFGKFFKRKSGLSPSEYRGNLKE